MARMAGDARVRSVLSWGVLGVMLAIGCAIERAPGSDKDWIETESAPELLAVVGPEVVLPALERFSGSMADLETAVAGWSGDDSAGRAEAQAAFAEAVLIWEELELMQLGPAASSLSSPVGEDVRDEIYSWPTVNPCRVDQVTADESYAGASFVEDNLVNAYGLDALEHLLTAGPDNACPNQVDINADGTWDALGAAGVAANRAAFAQELVALVQAEAAALQTAWDPAGGDLSGGLAAGADGPWGSEGDAINAVFDALFYLYTTSLHLKLEAPMGLRECGADDCTETVELRASGLSTQALAANLRGFRSLFTGADSTGMDDLLEEVGHGDLATSILAELDTAQGIVDSLGMPMDQAIVEEPAQVEALQLALKNLGELLKGDVATVLSLDVPAEAAGDND